MTDVTAVLPGLLTGLSLIAAIGAQNAFVIRQGLTRRFVFEVALVSSVLDATLILLGVAGLGVLISSVPILFEVIRWVGVAYLLWLALATLRSGPAEPDLPMVRAGRAFRQGLMVNLTNPKVILFVLAFVPQFVTPDRPVLPQFLIFGAVLGVGGFAVNGLVGGFAGGAGQRLLRSEGFARWLGRISAGVFVALAARLALVPRG